MRIDLQPAKKRPPHLPIIMYEGQVLHMTICTLLLYVEHLPFFIHFPLPRNFFFVLQIKNEFPRTVTLYKHDEHGTTLLVEVQPMKTYSLPVSVYMEKTPLKIGMGYV